MIPPITAADLAAATARMNRQARALGIEPIKAICTGRDLHEWTDENGNGRIRAPSLKGCQCFWCGADLVPHPSTVPQQVALI